MSRVAVTPHPDLRIDSIVVGIDFLLGWFVQVWEDETEDPTVDLDRLSQGRVLEILDLYADPDCIRVKVIRDRVVLDIDPDNGPLPPMRSDYDRTTDSMDKLTQELNPEAPF
jgi:hypothetical protein